MISGTKYEKNLISGIRNMSNLKGLMQNFGIWLTNGRTEKKLNTSESDVNLTVEINIALIYVFSFIVLIQR